MQESESRDWRGYDMIDPDGSKIGTIEDFFVDRTTERPEWALVNTGLFGMKQTLVPFEGASLEGNSLRVPFEKASVKGAPSLNPGDTITEEDLAGLYRYYGLDEESRQRGDGGTAEAARERDRDEAQVRDTRAGAAAAGAATGTAGMTEDEMREAQDEVRKTQEELRERQSDLEDRHQQLEQREADLETRVDEISQRESELGERTARFEREEGRERTPTGAEGLLAAEGGRQVVAPASETRLKRFGE